MYKNVHIVHKNVHKKGGIQEMKYNSKLKIIDDNVFLTPLEFMIFETLLKSKGEYLQPKEIQRYIINEFGVTVSLNNIKVHICRINKKVNGLITNRPCYGYYINKKIKNG